MRVDIIEEDSYYKLESMINKKLKYYKNEEIIDIKYSGTGFTGGYGTHRYSAMIILK